VEEATHPARLVVLEGHLLKPADAHHLAVKVHFVGYGQLLIDRGRSVRGEGGGRVFGLGHA
jgi:hypothetical protein